MKFGSVKESASNESRIAMTPDSAIQSEKLGYQCLIEAGAGKATGFSDDAYRTVGVTVVEGAAALWFYGLRGLSRLSLPFSDFNVAALSILAVFYGIDWVATVLERILVQAVAGEDHREAALTLTAEGPKALAEVAPLWERVKSELLSFLKALPGSIGRSHRQCKAIRNAECLSSRPIQ